ncbi:MAG: alanine racemase, partial [Synergistes sp.]|nr:alanine racemase [Synergistes sp.]
MRKYERVHASIDLSAVKENYRNLLGGLRPETKAIAVVKADAYGHGAVRIAQALAGEKKLWGFAAATAEEAI